MLLQHRRDGDGSGEVEAVRLHAPHRAVDGGAEDELEPHLRARLTAAVPAGVRRTRSADRAQVESARIGRRQRARQLQGPPPRPRQPAALERQR